MEHKREIKIKLRATIIIIIVAISLLISIGYVIFISKTNNKNLKPLSRYSISYIVIISESKNNLTIRFQTAGGFTTVEYDDKGNYIREIESNVAGSNDYYEGIGIYYRLSELDKRAVVDSWGKSEKVAKVWNQIVSNRPKAYYSDGVREFNNDYGNLGSTSKYLYYYEGEVIPGKPALLTGDRTHLSHIKLCKYDLETNEISILETEITGEYKIAATSNYIIYEKKGKVNFIKKEETDEDNNVPSDWFAKFQTGGPVMRCTYLYINSYENDTYMHTEEIAQEFPPYNGTIEVIERGSLIHTEDIIKRAEENGSLGAIIINKDISETNWHKSYKKGDILTNEELLELIVIY